MSRALSAIAIALLAGCTVNNGADAGMDVLNNTAVIGTVCTLTGLDTQPITTHGEITTMSPNPYVLTPLIESRITPPPSGDNLQRTIELQGADITLTAVSAGATISSGGKFGALFAGNLDPMGEINVSFDLVPVAIIQSLGQQMAASGTTAVEIEASITVYGTLGGSRIEASPFTYGVTVCTDCIVNPIGMCNALVTTPTELGDPCNPYQDQMVDCCYLKDMTTLLCPAAPSTN